MATDAYRRRVLFRSAAVPVGEKCGTPRARRTEKRSSPIDVARHSGLELQEAARPPIDPTQSRGTSGGQVKSGGLAGDSLARGVP